MKSFVIKFTQTKKQFINRIIKLIPAWSLEILITDDCLFFIVNKLLSSLSLSVVGPKKN